jgi:hypothetical protein
MNRLKLIKNFINKDECKYALETADYSFIKFKLDRYIKFNIKLKGYVFTELSPLKLNHHIVGFNDSRWIIDSNSYISFLLQLNDEYEQGYFQFLLDEDDNYFQLHHGCGHLVLFFSNLKHRTTPIESGEKYTISTSISITKDDNYTKTLI